MAVAVREMQREEYPLLEEFLYEAVFRRPGERVARGVVHRPELAAYIADFGARPGDLCLCAEADGRLAGAIWARRMRGYGYLDGETPELSMSVLPDARGQGVGGRLLRAMLDALRDRGYRRASLSVNRDNFARGMYAKVGFQTVREDEDSLVMAVDLRGKADPAMETHAERAARLFREGCNCAQSVFVAYCDWTGFDREKAIRLSASFGGGMGRLREVCGALSGALMALGMLRAPLDPTDRAAKAAHYARVQALGHAFRAHNGSLLCRDLLGDQAGSGYVPDERTEAYYQSRPCERLIYDAAHLLERMILEGEPRDGSESV